MPLEESELLEILKNSIYLFYLCDFYMIEDSHKLHEQAITHRIAHYFENIMAIYSPSAYSEYQFDVEYNKNLQNPKEIFTLCWKCQRTRCPCKKYQESQDSRPDFLIHKRGKNDSNLLLVEFKKSKTGQDNIAYDKNKLRYFTCMKGEYRFFFACSVILQEKNFIIETFQNGKTKGKRSYAAK